MFYDRTLVHLNSQLEPKSPTADTSMHQPEYNIDDNHSCQGDIDDEQLQRRHTIVTKRFESLCNRITATIADMTVAEMDIQRKDVEQSHTALREIALDRMIISDDPQPVIDIETTTDALALVKHEDYELYQPTPMQWLMVTNLRCRVCKSHYLMDDLKIGKRFVSHLRMASILEQPCLLCRNYSTSRAFYVLSRRN